jgi:hypothetical protein
VTNRSIVNTPPRKRRHEDSNITMWMGILCRTIDASHILACALHVLASFLLNNILYLLKDLVVLVQFDNNKKKKHNKEMKKNP